MDTVLLIDFGASKVKSSICNLANGELSHISHLSGLENISTNSGHYELSLSQLQKQFKQILNTYYYTKNIKFKAIFLCSQMHGFALLDQENQPLTEYISWKDERSTISSTQQPPIYKTLKLELENKFQTITGLKIRPSFPYFNLFHLAKNSTLPSNIKIITLPDWLAQISNKSTGISHPTMLAGLGIWDIFKNQQSEYLQNYFYKETGIKYTSNKTGKIDQISGYWIPQTNINIPIYNAVGDHQCALLGSQNIPQKTLSINIGTGSQISILNHQNTNMEIRPYFKNQYLSTITHIPAGRALTYFSKILNNPKTWEILANLSEKDILNSTIEFDLAFFQSAYNYTNGGQILNINPTNYTPESYLAGLLKSLIYQYIKIIQNINLPTSISHCILSGGVPAKLPQIKTILEKHIPYPIIIQPQIDETLLGLKNIALQSLNKITSLQNAKIYANKK